MDNNHQQNEQIMLDIAKELEIKTKQFGHLCGPF